jgi:hypothetical protein
MMSKTFDEAEGKIVGRRNLYLGITFALITFGVLVMAGGHLLGAW